MNRQKRPAKRSTINQAVVDMLNGRITPTEVNAIVARHRTALKMFEKRGIAPTAEQLDALAEKLVNRETSTLVILVPTSPLHACQASNSGLPGWALNCPFSAGNFFM
jgi:hypothetical protein